MPPRTPATRYPIRTAARLSGLTTDTLRVWERRYAAVEPSRTDGGARFYSDAELSRLTLLRRAVDGGHTIRHIAQMSDGELRKLIASSEPATPAASATEHSTPLGALLERARNNFLEALERFDLAAARLELERVATFSSSLELAVEMVAPLTLAIGERWSDGRMRVGHAHAAYAAMRSLLGKLVDLHQASARGPLLVATTLDGDLFEIGALLSALVATSRGWRVCHLGSAVPAEDVVAAAEATEARAVAISVAWPEGNETLVETLRYLRQQLPPEVELWLGAGTDSVGLNLPRSRPISDLVELDRHLAEQT